MYEYRARVASVYDGDTVRLDVDLGFKSWLMNVPFRLAGIDAVELGSERGREARDWLRARLPVGHPVVLITQKDKTEKYGRYLAEIYLPESPDPVTSLNQQLVDAGYAVPYDGGPR